MPGTIVFKPIKARLHEDNEGVVKMDPYCKFKIGWHHAKTSAAKHSGLKPHWSDTVVLEQKHDEKFAKLKIKDLNRPSLRDVVGETKIDLAAVAEKGKVHEWYSLYHGDKLAGEILLDITYDSHC